MDISSLIKAIFDPQLNSSAWMQQIVKAGDVFSLKIIDIKDNQRALVDFGKFRAIAEIKFPVQVGAELLVKVTDTDGQLRLRLIDPDSKTFISSKSEIKNLEILSSDVFSKIQSDIKQTVHQVLNLPDSPVLPESIRKAMAALAAHFAAIDLNKAVAKWFPLLKSYVENAGFFFETKLKNIIHKFDEHQKFALTRDLAEAPEIKQIFAKDIKPMLLMLKEYLEAPDSNAKLLGAKSFLSLKNPLDLLLTDIVDQQARASQRHERTEPYHVFLCSIPLKEKRQKATLKLYCPKKKKNGSKAGFKISVFLEMERIGEIRTDFFLVRKDLTITFFVKDNARKKQFEEFFIEMRNALDPWFDYLVLRAVVSGKKIRDFHYEHLDLGKNRQIDLRI
jgi:hypothetical protein